MDLGRHALPATGGVLLRVELQLISFRVSRKPDSCLRQGSFRWTAVVTLGIFTYGRQTLSFQRQPSLSLPPRLASWTTLLWTGSRLPVFPGGPSCPISEPAFVAETTSHPERMLLSSSSCEWVPHLCYREWKFTHSNLKVCLQAPRVTQEGQASQGMRNGHLFCRPGKGKWICLYGRALGLLHFIDYGVPILVMIIDHNLMILCELCWGPGASTDLHALSGASGCSESKG